ncbi:hypothetical protein pdam_00022811, partial [Pocillopora damicornis]
MTFVLACLSALLDGFLDRDKREGDYIENSKDLAKVVRLNVFRFSEAFKLHSMLSSCCYCHTPYCMVLSNWTPLSAGVQQIYYMDFVSERQSYFTEWMSTFDWLGLLLILYIIPFQYIGSKAQWIFASLAVLLNFLKIFKFSCVTRTTGLYTKSRGKDYSGGLDGVPCSFYCDLSSLLLRLWLGRCFVDRISGVVRTKTNCRGLLKLQ